MQGGLLFLILLEAGVALADYALHGGELAGFLCDAHGGWSVVVVKEAGSIGATLTLLLNL